MNCRYVSRTEPRVVANRHRENCLDDYCKGCQPCTEPHCRICARTHADGTCAECLAATRETLHEIARMCDALPEEVEHRGIDGEAMMLLGPAADPEARGHLEASVMAGRVPADYLEHADSELHPLFVLGTWDGVWREHLEHDEAGRIDVPTAVDYLDRQMTYMAGDLLIPFEDFARDLRRCAGHMEAVLHDGEQRDTGAPCMTCRVPLERVRGDETKADGWRCPKCRETSTDAQYLFAVQHLHREVATHLTDREVEIRTGVKAGTVRSWARSTLVGKRTDSGRTLYAVEDVLFVAREKGMIA